MKRLDNVSHRAIAFTLEDGRPIHLIAVNRGTEGPAADILNTAVFALQKPYTECSREESEAAFLRCLFHVLLTTETKKGEPPDAVPSFERVDVLDTLCPKTTDTGITMRFRKNGKGSSSPIVRVLL